MYIEKYLRGDTSDFEARVDPLHDLDFNLAITFSNFELRSAYSSLNFVSLLGNST
jgi:hypothetical protein